MGISYSCSRSDSDYDSLDDKLEELIIKTLSFKGDEVNSTLRSLSFTCRESEPTFLLERSQSFRGRRTDPLNTDTTKTLVKTDQNAIDGPVKTTNCPSSRFRNFKEIESQCTAERTIRSPKYEAAVKLQKVYKSFRTRRKLADCAVLVEQRWWKLLDFALLKRSSVSFFDIERPESVISRWSRARTRAAMVGKGLSKDEKARKLALQHWLEAIDPRHRYGHNLHFYYVSWLQCESRQPFFYWLDVGEGKEVNLDRCPRPKLQQQCIKYLGPKEREMYEVIVQNGRFVHKKTGKLLDTSEGLKDSKWIFVLSTSKKLYVGQKKKGTFQHSSFLAGGATSAAGRLVVEKGILKAVWPHSGHYRPTEENFQELVSFFKENRVDLNDVKKSPTEEDEESCITTASTDIVLNSLSRSSSIKGEASTDTMNVEQKDKVQQPQPHSSESEKEKTVKLKSKELISNSRCKDTSAFDHLYAVCIQNLFKEFEGDSDEDTDDNTSSDEESKENTKLSEATAKEIQHSDDSVENVKESSVHKQKQFTFQKTNLFEDEQDKIIEPVVPQELILHRIKTKRGMKSLQLGKQLSSKWTTGAGPRIGIVRDYPSELQFQALEQVNLSPRSTARLISNFWSPCDSTGNQALRSPGVSLLKEATMASIYRSQKMLDE